MSDALCATCLHEKAEHGPLGDCFKQRPEGIHGPMCCQCVGYRTFDGFAANLRAQLAQAQERVKVVEGLEKDLTSQYEITCADCEHYNHSGQCQTCYCTSEKKAAIVPLDELAQRDAEIARLRGIFEFRQINWMQTRDGIFQASVSNSCNGWAMLGASSGITRDEAIAAAIATAESK